MVNAGSSNVFQQLWFYFLHANTMPLKSPKSLLGVHLKKQIQHSLYAFFYIVFVLMSVPTGLQHPCQWCAALSGTL